MEFVTRILNSEFQILNCACGGSEAETTNSPVVRTVPVHTATVQTRDLAETLTLTGTLDPRAEAVMALDGTVDYFINNVFNFPTLAEAYKVAALNGLNKLRHM